MIIGAHAIIYSRDADADRAFIRDVLGFDSVDAGGGWLIFALPPAEIAVHPDDVGDRHELYLMCDDIEATVLELKHEGVKFAKPIAELRWGRLVSIQLPGGGELGLYQPKHPIAITKAEGGLSSDSQLRADVRHVVRDDDRRNGVVRVDDEVGQA